MSNRNFILKIGGKVDPSLTKSFNQSSKEVKKLSDHMKKVKDINFAKGSEEVKKLSNEMKNLKTTSREISKLEQKSKKLETQFTKGRKTYSEQQRSLFEMTKKTKDLKKILERTSKPTKKMINEFKKAKLAEDKLRASTDKERKSLTDLMRKMKSVKQETNKYGRSQEELSKQISQVSKRQNTLARSNEMAKRYKEQIRLSKEMKKALYQENQERFKKFRASNKEKGRNSLYRGVGQAVALGVGVKFAIDDESAFADVKKTTGLQGKEALKFKRDILSATKELPLFNNQIYEIAAAAGQAGIKMNELTKFTKDTAMVSVAFDMETGQAGDMLATWRQSFKMTQGEVVDLADKMNYLGAKIKASPAQIAELTTRVGSLGKIANFSEAETAALGGTLVALGVSDTGRAATGLQKVFTTLSAGASASGDKLKALQKLGLDPVDLSIELQDNATGTMFKVFQQIKQLDKSEQLAVTKQLFGEEALSTVPLLTDNLKFLGENLKLVKDKAGYSGSSMSELKNKMDTTASSMKVAIRSSRQLVMSFTSLMLPAIKSTTSGITSLTDGINSFTEEHPQMSKALAYGITGLVGLRLASGGARLGLEQVFKMKDDYRAFMSAGKKIKEWKQWGPTFNLITTNGKKSFQTLKAGASIAGTGFKTLGNGIISLGKSGMALLFSPWGIALAALAGGVYLIYKNWDKVKEGLTKTKTKTIELWNAFKESPISKIFEYSPLGMWIKGIKKLYGYWKKIKGEKDNEMPPLQQVKTLNLTQDKNGKRQNTSINSGLSGNWNGPAYAKGGVVSNPHLALVGDGKTPESIIPHDGSGRSKNLWYNAGNKLGMFAGKGIPALASTVKEKILKTNIENKFEFNIENKPTIIGNMENIGDLLKSSNEDLVKMIKKVVKETIAEGIKSERRMAFD
ncbi:phage tail tape measure protein [Psychrilyobacter atlanticus]|uniref:phage tail tape measure protein n=1 Tax=Psychrilyobacter atlanticus TaxID=271091 RepID=UPI00040C8022|nr:phage tail tape measure protein [Psychrilyobacter atlanticus]